MLKIARVQPSQSVSRYPTRTNGAADAKTSTCAIWGGLCGITKAACDTVCAPFKSFKKHNRKNKFKRSDILKIIFVLLLAFAIYYTYTYKQRYYREAYAYVQGYTEAVQKYLQRK